VLRGVLVILALVRLPVYDADTGASHSGAKQNPAGRRKCRVLTKSWLPDSMRKRIRYRTRS